MKRFALTVVALATAFVLGRLVAPDAAPAHSTERIIEHRAGEQRVVYAPASGLTKEDVRSIVDDALASRAPAEAPQVAPADPDALPQAQSVVAAGIGDGRWTNEDRTRLRGVMDRLNREQMREVMTSLLGAINTGRVQLDTDGPPT